MAANRDNWCVRAILWSSLALVTQAADSTSLRLNQPSPWPAAGQIGKAIKQGTGDHEKEPRHEVLFGDVVIAGGIKGSKSTAKAQFYDPSAKKFTATGALKVSRAAACGLTLVVDPGNKDLPFFILGGAQASAPAKGSIDLTLTPLADVEEYDRDTAKFTTMAVSMSQPRAGCTATPLNDPDGTVLITGGLDGSGNPLDTAELFDPVTGTLILTAGNMISPRAFHTATLLTSGPYTNDVLITGGLVSNSGGLSQLQGITANTAELYHPPAGTFTLVNSTMSDFRAFHTATMLNDGTVLIAGGASSGLSATSFAATAAADVFDPTTQTFTPTSQPLVEPLLLHGATLITQGSTLAPTGTVLVTGGFDVTQVAIFSNGGAGSFTGSVAQGAELYDPSTRSFSCIGGTTTLSGTNQTVCAPVMKHPHAAHTVVALFDGTVLIAGGYGGKTDTSKAKTTGVAEIYHPSLNSFVKVGSMKPGVALGAASLPAAQELEGD
jgi:hypothetical protein